MTHFTNISRALAGVAILLLCSIPVSDATAQEAGVHSSKGVHSARSYFSPERWEHFDPMSGNVILTFTDLSLPGNAGGTLTFQRVYNSQLGASARTRVLRYDASTDDWVDGL